MLDAQALSAKLEELDGYAKRVLERGEAAKDDRLVLMGVETAGRNLERIFRIGVTTDLEQRLKALEERGQQP